MAANLENIFEAAGYFRDEKGKLYGVNTVLN